jgi:hypothetical protein
MNIPRERLRQIMMEEIARAEIDEMMSDDALHMMDPADDPEADGGDAGGMSGAGYTNIQEQLDQGTRLKGTLVKLFPGIARYHMALTKLAEAYNDGDDVILREELGWPDARLWIPWHLVSDLWERIYPEGQPKRFPTGERLAQAYAIDDIAAIRRTPDGKIIVVELPFDSEADLSGGYRAVAAFIEQIAESDLADEFARVWRGVYQSDSAPTIGISDPYTSSALDESKKVYGMVLEEMNRLEEGMFDFLKNLGGGRWKDATGMEHDDMGGGPGPVPLDRAAHDLAVALANRIESYAAGWSGPESGGATADYERAGWHRIADSTGQGHWNAILHAVGPHTASQDEAVLNQWERDGYIVRTEPDILGIDGLGRASGIWLRWSGYQAMKRLRDESAQSASMQYTY